MYLTCPACETQYKLSDRLIPAQGRKVRCTNCGHVWYEESHAPAPAAAPEAAPADTVTAADMPDDDISFRDTPPAADQAASFAELMAQEQAEDVFEAVDAPSRALDAYVPDSAPPRDEASSIPEVVKPKGGAGFDIPVVEYRPMGMGAAQFGFFAFLMLGFITLSLLFTFRSVIATHVPAFNGFYAAIGMPVAPPGNGLRLSEMTAQNVVADEERVLRIEARLANMTEKDMDYPTLQVTLRGPYGAVLKDWTLNTEKGRMIAGGESMPVKVELADVPEDGATAEIRVVKK